MTLAEMEREEKSTSRPDLDRSFLACESTIRVRSLQAGRRQCLNSRLDVPNMLDQTNTNVQLLQPGVAPYAFHPFAALKAWSAFFSHQNGTKTILR